MYPLYLKSMVWLQLLLAVNIFTSLNGSGKAEIPNNLPTEDFEEHSKISDGIEFSNLTVVDILCPPSYIGNCGDSSDPDETGWPTIDGNPVNPDYLCYHATYSDSYLNDCGNGQKLARNWTISNTCGDPSTECIQIIKLSDNEAPIITCPENVSATCGMLDPDITGYPVVFDECGSLFELTYLDQIQSNCFGLPEVIIRTWVSVDECGNQSSCNQILTIEIFIWTGELDTAWENSGNWNCNLIPDCNTDVVIPTDVPRFPIVNSEAECKTIYLEPEATIDVTPGYRLWVGNNAVSGLTCPADIEINLGPGECYAEVNYSVTTTAICSGYISQITGLECGSTFPIGTTTNCFNLYDNLGNIIDSCCFDITVNEFPFPTTTLACNDNVQVSLNSDCEAFINTDMILEGGPYGCYEDYIVSIEGYGSGFGGVLIGSEAVGETFNVTVTDPITGNSCWGTIAVEDKIAPQISCEDYEIECGDSSDPDSITTPVSSDNCGDVILTFIDGALAGQCFGFDYIGRTWIATDESGNTSTCLQTITILPASIDSVACPPDFVESCSNNNPDITGYPIYEGHPITEEGLCNLYASYSDNDTIIAGFFTIIRTWTIVDTCTSVEVECVQQLISWDNESPIITCPSAYETDCTESLSPSITGYPVVEDDCSTSLTFVDDIAEGDCETIFNIVTRTWTATDNSNNTSSCSQLITVFRASLDSVSCVPNYYGSCSESSSPEVTGYPVFNGYIISSSGLCNLFAFYSDEDSISNGNIYITRNWDIIDSCSNEEIQCLQEIILLDNEGPNMECPADIITQCSGSTDTSSTGIPTIYEDCSTYTLSYTDEISNGDCNETYRNINRIWLAVDEGGNSSSCSQIITISIPTILCPNDTIVYIDEGESEIQYHYTLDTSCTCVDSIVQISGLPSGGVFPIGLTENCFHFYDSLGILLDSCCFNVVVELAQCPEGSITFTTQAEIDSFPINYPGCTHISGTVFISDAGSGDIENLDGLSQIESLENLSIHDNSALVDLTGLNSITSILGNIYLSNNSSLTSLNGLNSIDSINGYLYVAGNLLLQHITGLNSLISIGGDLYISNDSSLTSVTGLNNLASIGGNFHISLCPHLTNLTGLSSIMSVSGHFYLYNNTALTNLNGLNSIESIAGYLYISGNLLLQDLTGLNSLTTIGEYLYISNDSSLTSVTGLNNLTSVGGDLHISLCPNLSNISGLSSVSSINGQLFIYDLDSLQSLSGLDNIDHTSISDLFIANSILLSICDVQSICDYLNIPGNPAIISGNASGCATRMEVESECGN